MFDQETRDLINDEYVLSTLEAIHALQPFEITLTGSRYITPHRVDKNTDYDFFIHTEDVDRLMLILRNFGFYCNSYYEDFSVLGVFAKIQHPHPKIDLQFIVDREHYEKKKKINTFFKGSESYRHFQIDMSDNPWRQQTKKLEKSIWNMMFEFMEDMEKKK